MPCGEDARARAYAGKAEILGKSNRKISNVAGKLQKDLLNLLMETNGDWELNQVPPNIAKLLDEIGNGVQENLEMKTRPKTAPSS